MTDNKINNSSEVINGLRHDWRQNLWDSRYHALAAITGIQRIQGLRIPCKVGLVYADYWFVGGLEDRHFVLADNLVNQKDTLINAGTTFDYTADPETVTLNGSSWRISDLTHTLQTPVTYEIPAADPTLLRQDIIVGDSSGQPAYLVGVPGVTAVAPTIPEGSILITSFIVSDADGTEEVPAPVASTDGEPLYGPAVPLDSQGKAGDSYTVTEGADKGKEYKKKTISGVTSWVLEYTPDSGGASSFAALTGDPEDNAALDTALDGKVDKVIGKSLIDDTEIARLAGVSNKFDGTFISLAALQAAFPTSGEGHEALVDAGSGTDAVKYIYDQQEGWISGGGTGASSFADLTGSPSDNAALAAALAAKVAGNASITGATKTKITYDSKGLVTAGADLVEADIPALSIAKTTGLQTALDAKASKPIRIMNEVLSMAGWTLVSGYYEYTWSNVNVTTNSVVDFIPQNASVEIVKIAEVLPLITVSAGAAKAYATTAPLANITVNVVITETI